MMDRFRLNSILNMLGLCLTCAPVLEQKLELQQLQLLLPHCIFILDDDAFNEDDDHHDSYGVRWRYHADTDSYYGKPFWYYIENCDSDIDHNKAVRQMRSRSHRLLKKLEKSAKKSSVIEIFESYMGQGETHSGKYFATRSTYLLWRWIFDWKRELPDLPNDQLFDYIDD